MATFKNFEDIPVERQIERWENVLRVLRKLTPHQRRKHWDMSQWGVKTDCGTVACAAGHCGLDPWFRRRGLALEFVMSTNTWDGEPIETTNFWDTPIVEDFFGDVGCEQIFFNDIARPVGQVIREVRRYIKALRNGEAEGFEA